MKGVEFVGLRISYFKCRDIKTVLRGTSKQPSTHFQICVGNTILSGPELEIPHNDGEAAGLMEPNSGYFLRKNNNHLADASVQPPQGRIHFHLAT